MGKDIIRPVTIQVGHMVVDVTYTESQEWPADEAERCGVSYLQQQAIRIRISDSAGPFAEDTIKEILLHEIQHFVWYGTQINNCIKAGEVTFDNMEEFVVSTTSPTLLAVLRTNADVFKYLSA